MKNVFLIAMIVSIFFISACENPSRKEEAQKELTIDTAFIDQVEKKADEVNKKAEELNKDLNELIEEL